MHSYERRGKVERFCDRLREKERLKEKKNDEKDQLMNLERDSVVIGEREREREKAREREGAGLMITCYIYIIKHDF